MGECIKMTYKHLIVLIEIALLSPFILVGFLYGAIRTAFLYGRKLYGTYVFAIEEGFKK
jgi:hypothetical protein